MFKRKLLVVVFGSLLFICCGEGYDRQNVIESWETGNQHLKIRVRSYSENLHLLYGGAYYVYESSRNGEWSEIMTIKQDDLLPIDKSGVKFVNEDICYFYSGSRFAVTTDAGDTWYLWNGQEHVYVDKQIVNGVIKHVEIRRDGQGEMIVWVFSPNNNDCQMILTSDYGRSWTNGDFVDPGKCSL